MVFFSSFLAIAGNIVQQIIHAGAQKRHEKWLLRLYLRQHGIPMDLKMRVNRYVNVVLESVQNQVSAKDAKYIKLLSKPLQDELQTEQYLKHVKVHPFFYLLDQRSPNVMRDVCCAA